MHFSSENDKNNIVKKLATFNISLRLYCEYFNTLKRLATVKIMIKLLIWYSSSSQLHHHSKEPTFFKGIDQCEESLLKNGSPYHIITNGISYFSC